MLRKTAHALAILVLAAILVTTSPLSAFAEDCSGFAQTAGTCSTGFTEQDVWLEAQTEAFDDVFDEGGYGPTSPDDCVHGRINGRCQKRPLEGATPTGQPITMSDIARFRPRPPIDTMEPNGWAIIGLDTNFYSTGGAEVVDGTLLGQPASVRFSPVSWRWTYGDGTSSVASTRGGSWASQGILEFDPTPTSHVYREPGTYLIDLSVDYRAEYRFGAGAWTRIPGVLSVPANQLEATAGDAKTVLVSEDCTVNPRGSGC